MKYHFKALILGRVREHSFDSFDELLDYIKPLIKSGFLVEVWAD